MKKSLVVLLIAVLVAGYAFAETYTGTATATATYSLTDKTFEYATADTLEAAFTFEKTLAMSTSGTVYPYINVAGSYDLTASLDGTTVKQGLDLDAFEIVGEGWKLDLLAKSGLFDMAKSAIDTYYVKAAEFAVPVENAYTLSWGTKGNEGIAYTNDNFGTIFVTGSMTKAVAAGETVVGVLDVYVYDENGNAIGWKAGKDADDGWKSIKTKDANTDPIYVLKTDLNGKTSATSLYLNPELYRETTSTDYNRVFISKQQKQDFEMSSGTDAATSFQVEVETKELAVTDALTAQFAGGYEFSTEDGYSFGVGAKFAYNDAATLAFDFAGIGEFDVAASLKVGVFTFDGYFATNITAPKAGTYYKYYNGFDPMLGLEFGKGISIVCAEQTNYLSLRAVADVKDIATKFTATAQDCLLPMGGTYSIVAENTYIPGYTFTAGLKNFSVGNLGLVMLGAKAEYENGLTLAASTEFKALTSSLWENESSASVAYSSDDFEVAFEVGYAFDENKQTTPTEMFNGKLSSTFHAEKFDVVANAYFNSKADKDAGVKKEYWAFTPGLIVEAGVKTDKLVDGAEFSLMYTSDNLFPVAPNKLGSVAAALKVTF